MKKPGKWNLFQGRVRNNILYIIIVIVAIYGSYLLYKSVSRENYTTDFLHKPRLEETEVELEYNKEYWQLYNELRKAAEAHQSQKIEKKLVEVPEERKRITRFKLIDKDNPFQEI